MLGTIGSLVADSSETTGLKWQAVSSGGMTLIESGNLTGASVTTGSIPNTYENLQVLLKNAQPATDGAVVCIRFNSDTGTNYSLLRYTQEVNQNFGATFIQITEGIDNTAGNSFSVLNIPDYANTTTWKILSNLTVAKSHDSGTYDWNPATGIYNSTSAISTITFFMNNGNLSAGTYEIWGIK